MTISETTRREMHARLVDVLGMEAADTLMEYLPPVGWADVATKHDIDALGAATKHDLDALGAATKRDLDALALATKHDLDALAIATKHDIDALGAATKRDLDALGTRIDALSDTTERNFDGVRSEFRYELRSTFDQFEIRFTDKLNQQTRTLLLGASAMMAATISAVSALVSITH